MVTTAIAAVAIGTSVASSQAQKKGAKKAAKAFQNVGVGIEKMDKVEASIRQLMGVSQEDAGTEKDTYNQMRTTGNQLVQDQMEGKISESTRQMLGMRALASGAPSLGVGAVEDAYTGYLGLTMESQAQLGFNNYRAMFGQLSNVATQQMGQNYNMQYNAAAVQANAAMQQAQATASMWQGIGSAVGGALGGFSGGTGGGGGGFGGFGGLSSLAGSSSGPSTIPQGYQPRTTSARPYGI